MGYVIAGLLVALALWRAIARPVEARSRAMLLVTAGVFCGVLAVHVVAFDLTLTGSSVAMLLAAGALVGLGCGLLVRITEGGQNGMVHGVGWILAIPTLTAAGIQVAVAADSLTSTTLMFAALYGTTALAAAALRRGCRQTGSRRSTIDHTRTQPHLPRGRTPPRSTCLHSPPTQASPWER